VLRGDLQLASDTLLSLERIAVGGMRTVRGYRENLLVRDNAVISSAELRIPLLRGLLGDDVLELAPFVDFAYAWDDQRHLSGPSFPGDAELSSRALETLSSVGVGLRYGWGDRLQLEAYWVGRLRSVERSSSNIQDNGAHLSLTLRAF
jgi:hemolysin activation/secretion protein